MRMGYLLYGGTRIIGTRGTPRVDVQTKVVQFVSGSIKSD